MQNDIDLKSPVLKNATLLYLEDEEVLLNEISQIFSGFFKEVISATDGEIGLEIYKQRSKDIDIIITDINMPNMNGLEFMSEVRKHDTDIPILICTAFNDTEDIIQAIKLKVTDYIVKPVQMTTTLKILYQILEDKDNALLIRKQKKELEQYKAIFDKENLVIETSLDGTILYVNKYYCEISGYKKEELIGQSNSLLKHHDTSKLFAKELWKTVSTGQTWHGKMKNVAKSGDVYYVKYTIFPIFDKEDEIEKYMATGFLITEEEEEKQSLKRFIIKQKTEKVQLEHEFQNKLNSALQEAINNTHAGDSKQKEQLISLVNELDNELKTTREKYNEGKSRLLNLEHKLKDANHKIDTMQGEYQDKVDQLHELSHNAIEKHDVIKQKNMILENKLEKAQDSIKIMQRYIDDYRNKIDDLTDIVNNYEEQINSTPKNLKFT